MVIQYIMQAGFPEDQCLFGTAFEDRADSAFKKCLPELAWGTFVWFRSEPDCLVWLYDEPFSIKNSVRHEVKERRSAFITAAVTGQIDLRGDA